MAITPDCIEPRLREWLTGLVEESVEESVSRFCFDPFALTEARLHWNGCPACRSDFSGAGGVFERVRLGIEERVEGSLCQFSDEFSACKDSVLSAQQDLGEAYAEILARLVLCGNEVQGALSFAYGEVAQFTVCSELAEQAQREPLSKCAVVICRLEPKVWKFVFESVLCEELFSALYRKFLRMTFPRILTLDSKTREKVFVENDEYLPSNSEEEFIPENLRKAIRCIEVKPELLYQIMQSAASNYLHEFANAHGVGAFSAQKVARNGRVLPVQPPVEESRLGSADWQDSLDSLKAGQMELVRLIEHNRRPATTYEPYIAGQLGAPLYSRLHEKTQRALQLAEYLYNINQEPDGFSLTAIRMAQGYENELILRIIWPFVHELQASGADAYDAQGRSREPLIRGGKVPPRSMTLGTLGWYLKEDPVMRSRVSALGFDAEAISKDAVWVNALRNKAAHDFACDRAVADDLRRRILRPDDLLSRLHPTATVVLS
jgi:hypothetical protein